MKPSFTSKRLLIPGFLLFLFFAGCGQSNDALSTQTRHVPGTAVLSQTISPETPLLVTAPSPTSTSKVAVATQTHTEEFSMPTATSSLTPLPTLSAEDAQTMILGFMQDNDQCPLPCLWGIIPGGTDLNMLDTFLTRFSNIQTPTIQLGKIDFGYTGGIQFFIWKEKISYYSHLTYYRNSNILEQLVMETMLREEIPNENPVEVEHRAKYDDPSFNSIFHYYMLPNILSVYGKPSQILLQVFPDDPDAPSDYKEWRPFNLMLVYEDLRSVIVYTMPREQAGDAYTGCPLQSHIQVTSWAAAAGITWQKAAQRFSGYWVNAATIDDYQPIEEVTSWNPDTFYREFKNPSSIACLKTPAGIWPEP